MSRAEEAALKAYPEELITVYGPLPGASAPCIIDSNRPYRVGFKRGYEQAEKDLELTWEDIRIITKILEEVTGEDILVEFYNGDAIFCYKEVLRRFKRQRNEN